MNTRLKIQMWQIVMLICLVSGQSLFAQKVNASLPAEWQIQNQTPASHLVLIPADVIKTLDLLPDECIGAFTEDGHCAGVLQVNAGEKNYCLTLYGDDPFTPVKDGFAEGEAISLRLIAPSSGKESVPEFQFDPTFPNQGYFTANGISKVKSGALTVEPLDKNSRFDFAIYPNPTKDRVKISWKQKQPETAHLVIYNTFGQVALEHNIVVTQSGNQQIDIDVSGLRLGAYFVKLEVGKQIGLKKLLVFL